MVGSLVDLVIACRWFIALVVFDIIVVLALWALWVKFIKFIDKKYGERIRHLVYRSLAKAPFHNSSNRPDNARPNRNPYGDCGIYPIKKVQHWFNQSIRIHLAIKHLAYKSLLGLPSNYRNHESGDTDDPRNIQRLSHNPKRIIEGVTKRFNRNRGEPEDGD
jgi:hypothetical protein